MCSCCGRRWPDKSLPYSAGCSVARGAAWLEPFFFFAAFAALAFSETALILSENFWLARLSNGLLMIQAYSDLRARTEGPALPSFAQQPLKDGCKSSPTPDM